MGQAPHRRGDDEMAMHKTKIGLFGIGLDTYWPPFKGLKTRLEGYLNEVHRQLARSAR